MVKKKGKGLLLLSGGFDSPVAGHLMQKQGLRIEAVHFSLEPVTDDKAERKCMELARFLGLDKVYIARIGKELTKIASVCTHRYYFVLSKRFMLRIAERIAKQGGHNFIVTGENLGQVSSQTLQNLTTIDRAVRMPVLRPLLGFDKDEIIKTAKTLGTYEVSKGPEICDALGPKGPSTEASDKVIEEEETKLELNAMTDFVMGKLEEHELVSDGKAIL